MGVRCGAPRQKKTKTFSLMLLKLSLISPVGNTCDKTRNGWGSTRITQTSSAREAGFCAVCVLKFTLWSAASRRKCQDSCSAKERKLLERQTGPCNVCVLVRGRARCRQGSRHFPGQTYRADTLSRHAGQTHRTHAGQTHRTHTLGIVGLLAVDAHRWTLDSHIDDERDAFTEQCQSMAQKSERLAESRHEPQRPACRGVANHQSMLGPSTTQLIACLTPMLVNHTATWCKLQ